MNRPKAETELEWKRQTAKDMAIIKRQGRGADLALSGSLKTGLLDDNYRGPGPANVRIDDWGTEIGPLEWMSPYVPNGSREVNIARSGGAYRVLGHRQGDRHALAFSSNWLYYSERNITSTWRRGFSERYPSGVVALAGLIASKVAPAHHDLILTLPEGHRPDERVYRGVNQSDASRVVYIEPDGGVHVANSGWTNGYVSLDGISFIAAGVADWEIIGTFPGTGLVNGWAASGAGGTPRMWKDPYGFVWFEGQINGGVTADGTVITALPVGYRSYKQHHMATATAAGYGCVGTDATGQNLTVKPGTANTGLVLGGVLIVTADARADNPWHDVAYFANSWQNFSVGGAFTIPSQLRRGDGLCVASGLMSTGGVGSAAFLVDPELAPAEHMLMDTAANNARGRIDIHGSEVWETAEAPRRFVPSQGSNVWFSLDTKTWAPG